jgi:hypothetical protein
MLKMIADVVVSAALQLRKYGGETDNVGHFK